LKEKVVERLAALVAETSSSLPEDVLSAIRKSARREERGSAAAAVLETILKNCALAKKNQTPLCQDTGTLSFFVSSSLRRIVTRKVIEKAVSIATKRGSLRCNSIDSVTGFSYDDNCALGHPVIYYVDDEYASGKGKVTLMMKGGGSENMSRQYSLPDSTLGAGRDLEGVRKCIIDAAVKAQGFGCAPGILGVCIGGDRATGYSVAKEQFLRQIASKDGESPDLTIRKLERTLLKEINSLGIGPMGLGGNTTVLDVKIASRSRLPASFFVTVAYMCWALRRRTIIFGGKDDEQ
jgi:fumarate hydratase class I